jgi:sugar O-acyltransferase (sialic acid O-acetyltransferase NeuD family)
MIDKVIVFGTRELSVMNHFYLTNDSPYKVVAFTVDEDYLTEDTLCGLPVVPFEEIEKLYPPTGHQMSILLGYRDVNRLRAQKYNQGKAKGYKLINYVSSKSIIWPGVELGDNCYIYESTIVQPFSAIGNNVVLSAGAIVGHHSHVKDHCFVSAKSTILGCVVVEPYCVLGANTTLTDSITIAQDCFIGAGSIITTDTPARGVYVTKRAELLSKPSNELAPLLTWSRDLKRR